LRQRHSPKIKFAREKSELDFQLQGLLTADLSGHNMFGWQANSATTNGVFRLKKPQFRIVESGGFSYIFSSRLRTKIYPDLSHNYVEYF
jgi:hypothetical protein